MAADAEARTPRPSPARDSRREATREAAVVLLMLAVIAGLGLAVLWPWRAVYGPRSDALERYAPSYDGWSSLSIKQEPDGRISLWQGANRKHLRNAEGYATELSKAARASIEKLYAKGDETSNAGFLELTRGATFIQERVTELDASGVMTRTTNLRLRNVDGEYIVSLEAQAPEREVTLTPPGLFLPSDLHAEKTWESAGQIGAQAQYTVTGTVAQADPYDGALGRSTDCVQVNVRFQISSGGQSLSDRRWCDRYCAGIGQADEIEMDASGVLGAQWHVIAASVSGAAPDAAKLPAPAGTSRPAPATAVAGDWTMTRIGRTANGINVGATIAPTYLASDPPALLIATYEGDLLALDARSTAGDVLWRFNPTGTIYGQPAFDPARGRIYFGASDKQLYALDSRGLYIWSFATGDNVATRPVIAGDLVIFGSEDRSAYAVEADSGKLRWQQALGSALVASPALATVSAGGASQEVAIFGSDDGAVYGLDAATGEQLWQYDAGKAVEAAIVVDGGQAIIASAGGTVAALDPANGVEQWVADLTSTHIVRDAMAVTSERVYVVDELGYLTAIARGNGRRIWQSHESDYFGAPLAFGDEVVVAASNAGIVSVGSDGQRRKAWSLASASDAGDTSPRLDLGPSAGGGALWLIDGQSVVRRIGSPQPGPDPLPLAWAKTINEPPFALDLLRATPVEQGDRLLALDEGGRLYRVDPTSGAVQLQAKTGSTSVFIEPLIAGDLLISASNQGLTASQLSDGATAWRVDGAASFEPPVLAGDVLIWTSVGQPSGVRLAAITAKTGQIRWERTFPSLMYAGGVVVAGSRIYSASPVAAFDLNTGNTLWEAAELDNGLGAPALPPDGETLYVGRITLIGGEIAALDAATGAVRWRQPLPGNPLNLLERPWLAGQVLVVPTLNGSIVGLNAANGAIRWLAELPGARFGAVTVADSRIYTSLLDGQMLILAAEDGRIIARRGDREGGLETYSRAQRPVIQGDYVIMSFGASLRGYHVPPGASGGAQ